MKRLAILTLTLLASLCYSDQKLRQSRLQVGTYPVGKTNSLGDVAGVRVGHATVNRAIGKSVARTGVTVILPAEGDLWEKPVPAAVYTFNGIGEATGFAAVKESGWLQTPIALTNTLSVGDVQKALAKWVLKKHPETESPIPVVMECDDSSLNDIHGFHVGDAEVNQAIETAASKFAEGSVGAGTGMISYDFKSGIGSSSRVITDKAAQKSYTVAVLVNANLGTGTRQVFRFLGQPVSARIPDLLPTERSWDKRGAGSIVMVVATDAPMDSRQLERLAKRAFNGVVRTGTPGYNGSGDFVIAFTKANRASTKASKISYSVLCDSCLNDAFEAVADAAEEAVLVSLLNSPEMTGRSGNHVHALPLPRLKLLAE